jgi:hypothetical protein
MSTKKSESKSTPAENERSSPMEYVSTNLIPRVVAGRDAESVADIPGAGPAPEDTTLSKDQ